MTITDALNKVATQSISNNMRKQGVCVLGSTGTVGRQTLEVVNANPSDYYIHSLCANTSWQALLNQCIVHQPKFVVIRDNTYLATLKEKVASLGLATIVLSGDEGITEIISDDACHIVMSAIVGAAGLLPTQTAIIHAKKVLIANKEPIVMVGKLLIDLAAKHGAVILPVDSEHNAIQQCLPQSFRINQDANVADMGVKRLLLTGSGGPFRERALSSLKNITVAEACTHPNWVMGPKISIDSATMMNKALELIEACVLFNVPKDMIDIVIHPQSIIHSMVEYVDGSIIAQMASSDMKVPIANAMAWPNRINSGATPLDIFSLNNLTFEAPDYERFPVLAIAQDIVANNQANNNPYDAVIFNAANEQAVSLFVEGKISFLDIVDVIIAARESVATNQLGSISIDGAIACDNAVRRWVQSYCAKK